MYSNICKINIILKKVTKRLWIDNSYVRFGVEPTFKIHLCIAVYHQLVEFDGSYFTGTYIV